MLTMNGDRPCLQQLDRNITGQMVQVKVVNWD